MENEIINSVHTCFHCGNTGILKYIGKSGWKNEEIDKDEIGNICSYYLIEHEDWYVFECPVCNKMVILSEYQFDVVDDIPTITTEYPVIAVGHEGVPNNIYSAFEAAVKTKGIDFQICLLSLRRVLEMICKDKQAEGKDLESKINDLVIKKILPNIIGDACWIIRQLGNMAAHADNTNIYKYDVEQVIDYVSTIINYLYSMPYRITEMKKRIEERRKEEIKSCPTPKQITKIQ